MKTLVVLSLAALTACAAQNIQDSPPVDIQMIDRIVPAPPAQTIPDIMHYPEDATTTPQ